MSDAGVIVTGCRVNQLAGHSLNLAEISFLDACFLSHDAEIFLIAEVLEVELIESECVDDVFYNGAYRYTVTNRSSIHGVPPNTSVFSQVFTTQLGPLKVGDTALLAVRQFEGEHYVRSWVKVGASASEQSDHQRSRVALSDTPDGLKSDFDSIDETCSARMLTDEEFINRLKRPCTAIEAGREPEPSGTGFGGAPPQSGE